MKCSIVKELLSNYADGLTSEETAGDIRKHLEDWIKERKKSW